jgi:hypothetical protein
MKHACATSLDGLESLLKDIRASVALKEKKRGVFYLGSKAFLHFHKTPRGCTRLDNHLGNGGLERPRRADCRMRVASRHRNSQNLTALLKEQFRIVHTTIQLEHSTRQEKEMRH